MKVTIVRYPCPLLTLGVLLIDRIPFCVTLELPWKDNEPNVSCIPVGTYQCKLRSASVGLTGGSGWAYEVMNVQGRSNILLHIGNIVSDIEGCILLGSSYKGLSILASKEAFIRFMSIMKGNETFSLTIQEMLF